MSSLRVRAQPTRCDRGSTPKPPDSLDAWECYHRGMWHFSKFEAAENAQARGFFERAIALDPGFATTHAAISLTFITEATQFRLSAMRPEIMPRAIEHDQTQLQLLMVYRAEDPANSRSKHRCCVRFRRRRLDRQSPA